MSAYITKQVAATLTRGEPTKSTGIVTALYRLKDILPKYQLVLADGKWASDAIVMNASDTEAMQLPVAYSSANRLAAYFSTDEIVKVTIVSPVHGTSNFLMKGRDSDALGFLCWQGRVTSITLTIPAGADDTSIEYFMFELPDLSLAASFRGGQQATGVAVST